MRAPMLWLLGLMLALLAAMAAKALLVAPPPVDPRPAAGEFDTGRAAARLERILGDERPHPADTTAGDAVRGRLVAEIEAMGLSPTVRDGRVTRCAVTSSSGSPELDAATCRLIEERFRYNPARTVDGDPVADVAGRTQRWWLGRD